MKPAGYYIEIENTLLGSRQAWKKSPYPTFDAAKARAEQEAARVRSFVRVCVVDAGNETVVFSVSGKR